MPQARMRPPGMQDALNTNKYFIIADYGRENNRSWGAQALSRKLNGLSKIKRPEMGRIYYPQERLPHNEEHFSTTLDDYFKLTPDQIKQALEVLPKD
jgi:hypothetical protein